MKPLIRQKYIIPVFLIALSLTAQAVVPAPDGGYPHQNTAEGTGALLSLTTGGFNTAVGYLSLSGNTTGGYNTANGALALTDNDTGHSNTANGYAAIRANTTGIGNTATGAGALTFNTTGDHNTASGTSALFLNDTGNSNTALGWRAGSIQTTGSNNIYIGAEVAGVAGESNTIRIGRNITDTFIDGINGATASGGAAVFVVGGAGKLGTMPSSARFKDEIKPMDKASEVILALRPVSFRYKKEVDPQRVAQFGLVAEDVDKISPDLVIRDAQGRPQTVRYEQVNAMLLNEFLKERKTVQEQGATIARLEKQIEALTAGLQKVSAQLELSKTAPQTVLNNQ
jgi:trimeric autotransporter adhesin